MRPLLFACSLLVSLLAGAGRADAAKPGHYEASDYTGVTASLILRDNGAIGSFKMGHLHVPSIRVSGEFYHGDYTSPVTHIAYIVHGALSPHANTISAHISFTDPATGLVFKHHFTTHKVN